MSSEGLSAVDAYDEVMHFASARGPAATRLAMHAAVAQTFRADLLHLLRLNFVPDLGNDTAIEADVLRAPFAEALGGGYYRFDGEARQILLDELVRGYPNEDRPQRVARLLASYYDLLESSFDADRDRLLRDYIETERWVALAYLDADEAARQLAAAINAMDSSDTAARMEIGGLVRSIGAPLIRHPKLLEYAAGVDALRKGEIERGEALLNLVGSGEVEVAGVRLEAPAKVIGRWRARYSTSAAPAPMEERHAEGTELASVLLNQAQAAADDGRYDDALGLLDKVSGLVTEAAGPLYLRFLRQHGVVLGLRGKRLESLDTLRGLLTVSSSMLGPEHPDTVDALSRVAWATFALGRYREAVNLQRKVVDVGEKIWGPDDERMVKAQFALAEYVAGSGNRGAAQRILEQLLETAVRHHGAEARTTIDITRRVASSLADWGIEDRALDLLEPVMRWGKRAGRDNPEYRAVVELFERLQAERRQAQPPEKTKTSRGSSSPIPEPRGPVDVFLSHSGEDEKFAETLARALSHLGLSVFHEFRVKDVIQSAEGWRTEVERAIRNCGAFLVLISRASPNSVDVQREVSLALAAKRKVVPILLARDVKMPVELAPLMALDLSDWKGDSKDPRLMILVRALEPSPGPPTTRPALESRPESPLKSGERGWWDRFTGLFSREDDDQDPGSGSPPAV